MNADFRFQSIARPSWRYRLYARDNDNPAHDWRRLRDCICSHLSKYDTMNDGEIQHSPDVLVQPADLRDVLASLAASLHLIHVDLDNEDNCQSKVLSYFWRSNPSASDKEIQFALDLKFSDKKETYYTFVDDGPRKSHAESKKHDRRWIRLDRIPDDVSPIEKVFQIISAQDAKVAPYGIIQHIATVIAIAKVADPEHWRYHVDKHLTARGAVFQNLCQYDVSAALNHFERITVFKDSVSKLRWARRASQNHCTRIAEERAELQTTAQASPVGAEQS